MLATLSGCYKYVPTELPSAAAGENVRLVVTRGGAIELADVTNIDGPVPVIRGEVGGLDGDILLLRVPVVSRQVGFHTEALAQNVRVPTAEILSVERREFDGLGTALLVGGGAAVASTVIFLIMDAFGESTVIGGGDPPEETRIPFTLFSVPIGM